MTVGKYCSKGCAPHVCFGKRVEVGNFVDSKRAFQAVVSYSHLYMPSDKSTTLLFGARDPPFPECGSFHPSGNLGMAARNRPSG